MCRTATTFYDGDPVGANQAAGDDEASKFITSQKSLIHHAFRRQAPLRLVERHGVGDLWCPLFVQPIHDPLGMLVF